MLIKGYLTGHEFDLLTLADLFPVGEPAVAVDDQGHYLSFSARDELVHNGGGLYDAASRLLRRSMAWRGPERVTSGRWV